VDCLLRVRELTVRYRVRAPLVYPELRRGARRDIRSEDGQDHPAVAGISFEIAPGEVVGLMGASGCGKTTVAMAVLGLLPGDQVAISGSVMFKDHELLSMRERELREIRGKKISMVYQEPSIALSPAMRVGDQIAEVLRAHRQWRWKLCREEALNLIARVGLPKTDRIYSAYPHQLSGGQLQRILLAQALACEPELVIADEPTAALDACSQAEFLELLRELKRQKNVSFLLISHTPEIQASLADRLLVMHEGQIVEQGRFEQVYTNPSHSRTRAMLRKDHANDLRGPHNPEVSAEEFSTP